MRTPETRTLPDGPVVELTEGADFRVSFDSQARRVELLQGTAHFKVRKDSQRPFLVSAGDVTARAVGTAFLVGIEAGQIALVVTEGNVALDGPGRADQVGVAAETLALVQRGESVAVTRVEAAGKIYPRVTPMSANEQAQRLAWRTPRLEFNGTALRDILEIVNRYAGTPLVLGERALGDLKLSGALRADRVDALLEMLEADFGLIAEEAGDRRTLRSSSRAAGRNE